MKKRFVVTFLLAGTTVLAAGASVGASEPLCLKNRVCIFDGTDYAGLLGSRRPGLGLMNVSSTANDKMDSWKNQTGRNAAWYHDVDGDDRCVNMKRRSRDPNINFYDSDELSSWRTNRGC